MYEGALASTSGSNRALKSGGSFSASSGEGMEGHETLSGSRCLTWGINKDADEVFGEFARAKAKSSAVGVLRREVAEDSRTSWRKLSMTMGRQ